MLKQETRYTKRATKSIVKHSRINVLQTEIKLQMLRTCEYKLYYIVQTLVVRAQ